MLTAYLAIGLLNILAQHNSYGINNDTDMNIYTNSSSNDDRKGFQVSNTRNSAKDNATVNRNWRNNYIWNKIKQKKHDKSQYPENNETDSNRTTGNRRYPSHHTLMPRYNNTGFNSGTLYPGSGFNSTVYNSGSSSSELEVQVATNTVSNVTPVASGKSVAGSITPVRPGDSSKTKVHACVICSIPCPAGRHREGVYCVKDNIEE